MPFAMEAAANRAWQCPICLDSFERPVLATCCGQSFCSGCLDAALRKVDACPMCRSPLLSGPFCVTPNRALQDALAALSTAGDASPASPHSPSSVSSTGSRLLRSPVDGDDISSIAGQNRDAEAQVSSEGSSTSDTTRELSLEASDAPLLNGDQRRSTISMRCRPRMCNQLQTLLYSWRMRRAPRCCRALADRTTRGISSRRAQLRRQLRQWQHWGRVHWASLQCLFYVALFFLFVFFLRVQEEEFAAGTNNLRRPA